MRHVVIHIYGFLAAEYLVRNATTYYLIFLVGNMIFFMS